MLHWQSCQILQWLKRGFRKPSQLLCASVPCFSYLLLNHHLRLHPRFHLQFLPRFDHQNHHLQFLPRFDHQNHHLQLLPRFHLRTPLQNHHLQILPLFHLRIPLQNHHLQILLRFHLHRLYLKN